VVAAALTDARELSVADLDAVVALVATQQQRADRSIVYVGETPGGIRAELEDLSPPWTSTLRVLWLDDAIAGAALAEWDEERGRAWVVGPWIAGDADLWARWARPLVEAVLWQLPPTVADHELSGSTANVRLARLARDLGWQAGEVNHAYVLRAPEAMLWPEAAGPEATVVVEADGLRPATAADLAAITPLHDAEFPATYFSTQQLIERASRGEQIVLVATGADGRVEGYVAGRVQPDGTGYVDFVGVDPAARGTGVGRRLLVGMSRRLLAAAGAPEVHLTVQDHRAPARALYEALGFRNELSFVGYRSRRP
jgi:ribosomal protein S18 acetylase RimI-like enzyme